MNKEKIIKRLKKYKEISAYIESPKLNKALKKIYNAAVKMEKTESIFMIELMLGSVKRLYEATLKDAEIGCGIYMVEKIQFLKSAYEKFKSIIRIKIKGYGMRLCDCCSKIKEKKYICEECIRKK